MKRSKRIVSSIIVILLLLTNLQLPYFESDKNSLVYALDPSAGEYQVTAYVSPNDGAPTGEIVNGPGSYNAGDVVTVKVESVDYVVFDKWTSDSGEVVFTDPESRETTFIMPDQNVRLTANFDEDHNYHFVVPWGYWIEEGFPVSVVYGYDEFGGAEERDLLQFNGAAHVAELGWGTSNPLSLRLTSSDHVNPDHSEGGSVFTKNKIHLGEDFSFTTFFRFTIKEPESLSKGGEGFTFTLQAEGSDAFSNHGPSMGTEGMEPSVSVAFDTRMQPEQIDNYGVPENAQAISVFVNGNYENPEAFTDMGSSDIVYEPDAAEVRGSPYYYAWIDYDGTSKTMEVYLAGSPGNRPGNNFTGKLKVEDFDLKSVFTTNEGEIIRDVHAGFTANTSPGAQQEHNITLWAFKNDAEPMYYYDYIYEDASRVLLSSDIQSGEGTSMITARVYNKYHEPVSNIPIDFSTSFGSLDRTSVTTDVYGEASVTLGSAASGTALVKAVAHGGAFAESEVRLEDYEWDVDADKAWLTDDLILNGNSGLYSVTDNVYMPATGENGSNISWTSSNESVIAPDGTVTRPAPSNGDQTVTLAASISKGGVEAEKTFTVTVKARARTEAEAVAADKEWLDVSRTLGNNDSQYSITGNLMLSLSPPDGSSITWESSVPAVISNEGIVTRPGLQEEHEYVTMTATLGKGNVSDTVVFEYTVLAEEDTVPPQVENTVPAEGSDDVIYDSRQITIDFNESIEKGEGWDEIRAGYNEMIRIGSQSWERTFVEVDNSARIEDDRLIVTLDSDMKSLRVYQLIIPQNAVEDLSGNNMSNEFTLEYKVEKVITGDLFIENSEPLNSDKNVSAEDRDISFSYSDETTISKGSAFNDISLRSSLGEEIPISRELNQNTVTLTLNPEAALQLGEAYEVYIPSRVVEDRFKRNSRQETIRFKTRAEGVAPEISSIYPDNGMSGVSVRQSVDISFSEGIKADGAGILLKDAEGNRVPASVSLYHDDREMVIDPVKELKPQTEYTVLLPGESVRDYSDNYFASNYEMSFTTGADSLNMDIINMSYMESDLGLNTGVELLFSSPAARGPNFNDIKISDSQGNTVSFESQESGSTVTLKPDSSLSASETYTVEIPYGAYRNENNYDEQNDVLRFRFTTGEKLDMGDASFRAMPSLHYVTGSIVTFSAEWLEKWFNEAGREITAFEWTFNEGSSEEIKLNGKAVEYGFGDAGSHPVILNVTDSKGFSYEFMEKAVIEDYYNFIVNVSSDGHEIALKSEDENYNIINYDISTSSAAAAAIKDIEISLYGEDGSKTTFTAGGERLITEFERAELRGEVSGWYLPHITDIKYGNETKAKYMFLSGGNNVFQLDYNDLPEGTYTLVFKYEIWGETQEIRRTLRVREISDEEKIRIILNDQKEGSILDEMFWFDPEWENLEIKVDGESQTARRTWFRDFEKDELYMGYEIDISYDEHEIQVFPPSNYYPSAKEDVTYTKWHTSSSPPLLMATRIEIEPLKDSDRPKINLIQSQYTDSRDANPKVFFENTSFLPALEVTCEVDWQGFEPGYVEFETMDGVGLTSIEMDGDSATGTLNLEDIGQTKGIKARIISEAGTWSPWVDAKIRIAAQPSFGGNFDRNSGEYKFYDGIGIDKLLAGEIPVLEDMPLLNNTNSFGLGRNYIKWGGTLEGDTLEIQGGTKSWVQSGGYTVKSSMYGVAAFKYDWPLDKWNFERGEIKIDASGMYVWKRSYIPPGLNKIPKIEKIVPAPYAKLIMIADTGATLIVKNGGDDYEGILYFSPYVGLVIGVGNDALNIEAYGGGRIYTEVHVPTGYVLVKPSITVGARYTFLIFKGKLFERVAETSWNNGKKKVTTILSDASSQSIMEALDSSDMQLEPMPRDYLERPSQWVAGTRRKSETPLLASREMLPLMVGFGSISAAAEETNPRLETIKKNIYPDAEVQLVQNGDELWMVWTDDNPDRSDMNRTQMMYSVLKDGSWSDAEWMGQDWTADFSPAVASTGGGVLMAWQNIKQEMPEDAGIDTFIENAEISVTQDVYKSDGSDVGIVTLTDDDKFDHSPKLAADGESALLTWTKSDIEAAENGDSLLFSSWDGSTWTDPEVISDSLPNVINSSLTMKGNEGLLLYTLGVSGDGEEESGQEIYARIYDGGSWGEAVKVADGTGEGLPPSNPKAVYSSGEWFITWHQGESIMCKRGLDGGAETGEFLSKVQPDYEIAMKDGTNPQIALVYKRKGIDGAQTLSTSFYDVERGIWSDEMPLTQGEGFVRSVDPVFTGNGRLSAAYTQAEVITEAVDGVEYEKPGNKVDLCTLTYIPVHDLALDEEDGLKLTSENPQPGSAAKVTAVIRNRGDFAEDAVVYFYDGDPEQDGVKIGEASTQQPIPARSSAEVEMEWMVDSEECIERNIYAVVDPDNALMETNESNNTIKHEVITADIAVYDLEYKNIAKNNYLVEARVKNTGSRMLEGVEVYLDQAGSEQPLQISELNLLEPGQKANVSFAFSSVGLTEDENGEINMSVTALLPDGEEEFRTDDNSREFELEPAWIAVESMNPGPGEAQVSIKQPLTLGFNMDVGQGTRFDEITLEDNRFNAVDIGKSIDGSTLTVTPQSSMEHDTRYTLTIPGEALGDSCGHRMEGSYELSFTTTKSSPEVVFTYPGNKMGNTAPGTDIRMKFNQDVSESAAFEDIELNETGSGKVPASVLVQGEWLYIYPDVNLEGNTEYTVLIPAGAVQNNSGEVLQDDYSLEFETVQDVGGGSGNSSSGRSSRTPDDEKLIYSINRQTSEDGRTTAIIDIDEESILKFGSESGETVVMNLTNEVRDDETVQINLSGNAARQLAANRSNLRIVTGKGDLLLPASLIESLAGDGENPITITIAENNEQLADNDRVSAGIFDFSITAGGQPVTEFNEEITVMIPLDMSGVGNARRVIVCVYDEEFGTWQPVGGTADKAAGSITFKTDHFSTYAAFETVKLFDDVTSDWAKDEVEILASRRLINGKTDNTFDPEGSITRAEFTALIVRSLYKEPIKSRDTFTDVDEDAWFANAVETAYDLGLIKGTGQDVFEPNAQISREQLAVIAYRYYQLKTGDKTSVGSDNEFIDLQDISSYAEEAVNFIANADIMKGSGGRFEPRRSTTRQEAAVVLYRLLERMGEL